MSADPAVRPRQATAAGGALSSLFARWTAYTLKRAAADVAATSDQEYRDFGLDRAEILLALGRLRAELDGPPATSPRRVSPRSGRSPAIVVRKQAPRQAEVAA